MADFLISSNLFLYALDILGTIAFAVTGAFKAIEHKADIFGIIVLATVTGVAGGITRDVIVGRFPPNALADPIYVGVTVSTAVGIFFLYSHIKKHYSTFLVFDAIGLGVFSMVGASVAFAIFGMNFLIIIFAGMITAIGGGILRDIVVNEIPTVFVKEVYAVASFVGILVFYVILVSEGGFEIAAGVGGAISIAIRLVAMKYNWQLPRLREK